MRIRIHNNTKFDITWCFHLLTFVSGNDIKKEEEYELFRKVCDILFERESYEELQRLAFSALGSPLFSSSMAIANPENPLPMMMV